ncbi:MAG: hypothetical protein J6I85_07100, partial [Clostridia bacterium]|nr:hypothetical protein [Clostridia bacterium]MBP3801767.1 hypothetical protein [Clostridia bacterium]
MKVLFTGCTFNDRKLNKLKDIGIEVINGRTDYSEDELTQELKKVDCYINGGDEICTKKVIENNTHLKLISFMGTGYQKYIDVDTATKYNIPVSYTPGANAKSVAEYTVALLLDIVKKISFSNEQVKDREWKKYKTFDLRNKTLGIVGMGAIGTHIAQILCNGFGMNLIYNSKTEKENINNKYNTKMVSLEEVFKNADVISINATYTEETKALINKKYFDLAKSEAIIVNTARQELINKDDLYEAIMNNKILAVAMDGFYEEPIMKECNDKLLDLPNDKIIITPHNAYNSIDAVDEMERMLIESMIDIANNNVIVRNIVK